MIEWLKGKKTYITALVVGLMAAAQSLGIDIPLWVFTMLAAVGVTTMRAGMPKS